MNKTGVTCTKLHIKGGRAERSNSMTISEIVKDILSKAEIKNIFFVACGGSRAACWPAKFFLETEAKHMATTLFTSNEFVHATPVSCNDHSIVVACSLRGTPETVEALRVGRERGAYTVAFTGDPAFLGDPDYALARAGKYMVPYRNSDKLSCLEGNSVKLFQFAVELLHQAEGYSGYQDVQKGLTVLDDVIAAARQKAGPLAQKFVNTYERKDTIYVIGSGPSFGTAYAFSICSLMEISWIHSPTVHAGEYFHGPFETTGPDLPVLLLKNEGATRALDERADRFLAQYDGGHQVLDAQELCMDAIPEKVRGYFNGFVLGSVLSDYLNLLGKARRHDRSVRRYMWQVAY